MCIAIYKPAGKTIEKDILKNSFDNNDDGCGFAYINVDNEGNRKIMVKKTLEFDVFWRQYQRAIRVAPDSPFLIHFRIKTHGKINKANCHPHMIDDEHVFIHNGIIKGMKYDKDFSDTVRFNKDFMQHLPEGWMSSDGIMRMISHIVDSGKVVMMNLDGDVQICNEKAGNWKDGVWYSNKSYEKRKTYNKTTYNGVTYGSSANTHACGYVGGTTLPSQKKLYSQYSTCKCTGCNKFFALYKMFPYYDKGEGVVYCTSCNTRILKEFKDMEVYKIPHLCYMEYYNLDDFDKRNTTYFGLVSWVNPWEHVHTDQDAAEQRFNEESEELIHAEATGRFV